MLKDRMPKKISNEVLQQAQELRTQGKPYEEISKALQVSMSWCWENLKNAQKETKGVVDSLEQKSKGKRGVSKAEIAKAVDNNQSKEALKKDVQKVSQRLRKRSKENLVRPNWMTPEFATFITDSIVNESMSAEQRMHEQALELRAILLSNCTTEEQENSIPSTVALKSAIATLTYTMTNQSSKAGSILSNWLESLYETAVKLEKRNTSKEVSIKVTPFVLPSELHDLDSITY